MIIMKWLAIIVLSIVLISGCTGNFCNPPYIRHEAGCCLDRNYNNICDDEEVPTERQLCERSGGLVVTRLCCASANDFPNTCLIGACGCSPDNSREVSVCECGKGRCWNGKVCTDHGVVENTTCDNYCSGSTLNYNGVYADGQCTYSNVVCEYGCENGACEQPWLGLEITDFSPNKTDNYGEAETITMNIKNEGDYGIHQFKALAYLTGSAVSYSVSNDVYWYSTESLGKTIEKYIGKDGEGVVSWNLEPPVLSSGQTRNDVFIGRTYYDYQTTANGNIWVYTRAEADAASQAGRSLNAIEWNTSRGPISIEVSRSDPFILDENTVSFFLPIKINNMNSGIVYRVGGVDYVGKDVTLTSDELNKIEIEANSPGLTFSDCTGEKNLYPGVGLTLTCRVVVVDAPMAFQAYPFTITAKYGYYTERTATVTAHGA
jgi:hypothetical protein